GKESERLCVEARSRGTRVLMGKITLGLGALTVVFVLAAFSVLGVAEGRVNFTTPSVMGYPPGGDDWEPAVASDGQGNVYYLTTHLSGVPGCPACSVDTMVIQVSHDGGRTFTAPSPLTISSAVQFDPQVKVNSAGVVFVSYLHGKDTVVQRSDDRGATWATPVAVNVDVKTGLTDKGGLAVQGTGASSPADRSGHLYVTYNAPITDNGPPFIWYKTSTDGGMTWSLRTMLNADATSAFHVFPGVEAGDAGDVRVAWMDNRTGAYNVWYRSSSDAGQTWSAEVKVSGFRSGYSYVTAQGFAFPYGDYITVALDPKGHVHIAWGEGPNYGGPGNVLYATS